MTTLFSVLVVPAAAWQNANKSARRTRSLGGRNSSLAEIGQRLGWAGHTEWRGITVELYIREAFGLDFDELVIFSTSF